ncbi:MAG: hypothetical protein V4725_18665 [Bacteroidota bacterium]|nr:hypothetical protein [Ferruginibacter sp.]
MNFEYNYTSPEELQPVIVAEEETLNDICETCGKWTTNHDDHCFGCKRPVRDCCC